jgi:hypothetical protein
MTQEEKQLLVKDLCARLPYEVQGITSEGVVSPLLTKGEADWDILTSLNYRIVKHGWRPYFRSMSSMTEEESEEYKSITESFIGFNIGEDTDWLNAHYFDYRGLIEKGLALEALEGMYNTKTE